VAIRRGKSDFAEKVIALGKEQADFSRLDADRLQEGGDPDRYSFFYSIN